MNHNITYTYVYTCVQHKCMVQTLKGCAEFFSSFFSNRSQGHVIHETKEDLFNPRQSFSRKTTTFRHFPRIVQVDSLLKTGSRRDNPGFVKPRPSYALGCITCDSPDGRATKTPKRDLLRTRRRALNEMQNIISYNNY